MRMGARWLLVAALGFTGGQIAALAIVSLVASATGHRGDLDLYAKLTSPPEWYVLSSLLGLWIGFLGAAAVAARVARGPGLVATFGLRPSLLDLRYLLLGLLAQFGVALMYLPFQDHISNFDAPTQRLVGSSHGLGAVVILIATGLLAPVVEEVFFRGLVLRALLAIAGRGRAVVGMLGAVLCVAIDGAIFAAAHFEAVQFAGLMALGCLLAYLAVRTERLGPPIATHVAFNLTALAFAFGSGG